MGTFARERAGSIVRRLVEAGHETYLCGGCVRDLVMGREPKDYDIATSATPDQVERLFPRTHPVGAKFGVILVVEDGAQFQVATFRTESGYADGRRPDRVEYSGPREDVQRRDFTVNGLLRDPIADRVLDWVGGLADIEKRQIRAIGEARERFREDQLRLLRAVRLAVELDFEIEGNTWEALRELAGGIRRVSWERIRDETLRILGAPARARGARLLLDSGLAGHILPEAASLAGDAWEQAVRTLENLGSDASPILGLAVLLQGVENVEEVGRRLRLSADESARLASFVAERDRFGGATALPLAGLKRLLALPWIDEHLDLHRAGLAASGLPADTYDFLASRLAEYRKEPERLRPTRLVSGDDLLAMGLARGRIVGQILGRIEEAQLAETISTREAALDLARSLVEEFQVER